MQKLAVIGWGIGGLGFYRSWKEHRPGDGVIYLSDSGFTPYGKLTEKELRARITRLIHFLKKDYRVTRLMVACNAASSVINEIASIEGIQIAGVIEGTCDYVRKHLADKAITIIGGKRTIESDVYSKRLADLNINQKIAQPLSALVERGDACGCEAEYAIRDIFEEINKDVVLACTHYVAMTKLIEEVFPNVRCHDPIPFIVEQTLENWGEFQQGKDVFLTTGDVNKSKFSAKLAFGVDADFNHIEIG